MLISRDLAKIRPMIVFYDSGVGGITVWKAFKKMYPHLSTTYFADNQYGPFGKKTRRELEEIWKKAQSVFDALDAHTIIVACHTMSAHLNGHLPSTYLITECNYSSINHCQCALLATKATLDTKVYQTKYPKIAAFIDGSDLVPLIERQCYDDPIIKKTLSPLLSNSNIEEVFLGCTHFPLFLDQFTELAKKTEKEIRWIDPASTFVSTLSLSSLPKNKHVSSCQRDFWISSSPSNILQKFFTMHTNLENSTFPLFLKNL